MKSTLVMTILGADRPGLVRLLAERVTAHGGNWLESRLCHLGGQFAGLVRVEAPEGQMAGLLTALQGLEAEGLRVVAHPGPAAEQPESGKNRPAPAAGTLAELDLVGHDRPGLVREITAVLAAHAVNVEELATWRASAPMDGAMLFQAHATIQLPAGLAFATLRAALEHLAADLMVDVELSQPES